MNRQMKNVVLILTIFALVLITAIISAWLYPKVFIWCYFFTITLYCVYKSFEILVSAKKLKKLAFLEWWVYAMLVYLLMNYEQMSAENIGIASIVFFGTMMFAIRMLVIYFKTDDWITEICILVGFIIALFAFAIVSVKISGAFLLFKTLTVLMILGTVKIKGHINRFGGMLAMCIAYLFLIVSNGVLNSNFLLSPVIDAEKNFYIAIQNLYTLPDLQGFETQRIMLENIIGFLMCRIMDAVLIGSLVDIFNEKELGWFESRK